MGKCAGFSRLLARWPPERAARRRLLLSYQPRLGLTRGTLAGVGSWLSATAIQRSADLRFLHVSPGPPDATPAAQVYKTYQVVKERPARYGRPLWALTRSERSAPLFATLWHSGSCHDVDDFPPVSQPARPRVRLAQVRPLGAVARPFGLEILLAPHLYWVTDCRFFASTRFLGQIC